MPLRITLQQTSPVPLEVEGVLPEVCRNASLADIEKLPIFQGNREATLGDFFAVSGDPTDESIEWFGDLSGVHWIGTRMSSGKIVIHQDGGRHIGSEMSGGEIQVHGSAGDWVGAELQGGLIHVHGNAGHLVGAAYRGSQRGMTGGTILIQGDVGNEIGHTMRRGLLAVRGNCGDLAGFNMLAGTLLVFGECGIRNGAGMRRGTIGLLGEKKPEMLPTFVGGNRCRPVTIRLLWNELNRLGFEVPDRLSDCDFSVYHGDMLEGGRGEILTAA